MMYGMMTFYEVSLLYYQIGTNSALSGDLARVINNWNDFSKCFYELIKSYIFFHNQVSY